MNLRSNNERVVLRRIYRHRLCAISGRRGINLHIKRAFMDYTIAPEDLFYGRLARIFSIRALSRAYALILLLLLLLLLFISPGHIIHPGGTIPAVRLNTSEI